MLASGPILLTFPPLQRSIICSRMKDGIVPLPSCIHAASVQNARDYAMISRTCSMKNKHR